VINDEIIQKKKSKIKRLARIILAGILILFITAASIKYIKPIVIKIRRMQTQ